MKTLTTGLMATSLASVLVSSVLVSSAAAHTAAPHVHAGAGVVDLAPAAMVAMAALWLGLRALRSGGGASGREGEK